MASGLTGCGVVVAIGRADLERLLKAAREAAAGEEGTLPREEAGRDDALLDALDPANAVLAPAVKGVTLRVGPIARTPFLGVDLLIDDEERRERALEALAELLAGATATVACAWWTLASGAERAIAFRGEARLFDEELVGAQAKDRPVASWPLGRVAAALGHARATAGDAGLAPAETIALPLDGAPDIMRAAQELDLLRDRHGVAPSDAASALLADTLAAAGREEEAAAPVRPAGPNPDHPSMTGAYLLLGVLAFIAVALIAVFAVMAANRG